MKHITMEPYSKIPSLSGEDLQDEIKRQMDNPRLLLVVCNDIRKIIQPALKVAAAQSDYEVYMQPNLDFYADSMTTGQPIAVDYEKQFSDYCNYFDKHRITSIIRINKKVYNYSRDMEQSTWVDYPSDVKLILVIDNFNFLDLNSQRVLADLREEKPNILVIGQIITNPAFAANHIDVSLKTGLAEFVKLEE